MGALLRIAGVMLTFLFFSLSLDAKVATSLYSESTYFEKYNLVTESKLQAFLPHLETAFMKIDSYLGVNFQFQSPDAPEKYYDSAVTPHLGLQTRFFQRLTLQFQAGTRRVLENEQQSEWDPRVIAFTGDMITYSPSLPIFTEYYGEASYVPRIDPTPVSTLWLKQGWRFRLSNSSVIDPYAELFLRESRNADLGPSLTQWRLGTRMIWSISHWSLSGHLYHNIGSRTSPWEGLLAIGGQF